MANKGVVYARIDAELKEKAEKILAQLGITPSSMISMLYSQVVIQNGVPMDLHIKYSKPLSLGELSQKELQEELQRGRDSLKYGSYSPEDVDKLILEGFGV